MVAAARQRVVVVGYTATDCTLGADVEGQQVAALGTLANEGGSSPGRLGWLQLRQDLLLVVPHLQASLHRHPRLPWQELHGSMVEPAMAAVASDLESKATGAFVIDDFELAAELYDDYGQAHIKLDSYSGKGSRRDVCLCDVLVVPAACVHLHLPEAAAAGVFPHHLR